MLSQSIFIVAIGLAIFIIIFVCKSPEGFDNPVNIITKVPTSFAEPTKAQLDEAYSKIPPSELTIGKIPIKVVSDWDFTPRKGHIINNSRTAINKMYSDPIAPPVEPVMYSVRPIPFFPPSQYNS